MVNPLMTRRLIFFAVALFLLVAGLAACGGSSEPAPAPIPDAATLLAETEANLRSTRSANFHLTHEVGSIFIRAFSAKLTEVSGSWDAELGAQFDADAYLVTSPDAEPESGVFIQTETVITPDAYYTSDPLSGAWIKQSRNLAPIPVGNLNEIMADLVGAVENPTFAGEASQDGANTYRIQGDAPASAMNWLPITAEEGQRLRVDIWTETERKLLRRARFVGAVGQFDSPDTTRDITISGINEEVVIAPPDNFIDLTGG